MPSPSSSVQMVHQRVVESYDPTIEDSCQSLFRLLALQPCPVKAWRRTELDQRARG